MGEVSIGEEIGWSRNAEAMLRELQAFGQDLANRTERESMRHTSKLVGLVPADTLVFASLPNVSQHFQGFLCALPAACQRKHSAVELVAAVAE